MPSHAISSSKKIILQARALRLIPAAKHKLVCASAQTDQRELLMSVGQYFFWRIESLKICLLICFHAARTALMYRKNSKSCHNCPKNRKV